MTQRSSCPWKIVVSFIILTIVLKVTANPDVSKKLHNNTTRQFCSPCNLHPQTDDYWRFRNIIQSRMVYVVYFNLLRANNTQFYPLPNGHEDIQFVWARLDYGKSLLTLPMDYTVLSMYLPFLFQDELDMQIHDKPSECFRSLTPTCRQQLISKTLMKFTRVDLDCNGGISCGTICQQNINLISDEAEPNVSYHCCQKIKNHEDCSIAETSSDEMELFQLFAIILSIIFATSITSWLLSDSLINTIV